MKHTLLFCCCLFAISIQGQNSWGDILKERVPENLRVSSYLYQLAKLNELDSEKAMLRFNSEEFQKANDLLILRITTGHGDTRIDPEYLRGLGIHVENHFRNTAEVHIDSKDILQIAGLLEAPYILKGNVNYSVDDEVRPLNEGPGLTNIDTYNAAGKLGQGINLGIIDYGWATLTASINAGVAPAVNTQYNYTTATFEAGTSPHGVGCIEMVFDYAPNASYFLYKIDSPADIGSAITQAISDGVDILVHSATYFNEGWADGTGDVNAAVKMATDAGIIWLNGAGNFNQDHYQNSWFDNDGNGYFNFTSTDERNNFFLPANSNTTFELQWEGLNFSLNDYDIEIYSAIDSTPIASGNSSTDFESVTVLNPNNVPFPAFIMIRNMGAFSNDFEFFVNRLPQNSILEYWTDGSTASPANSLEDRAITIGVVPFTNYDDDNPLLEQFSSRGPTNDGNFVPDLTAMDQCTALSYPPNANGTGGGFLGASAGGPNTMGMLAAFWSEHSYLSQDDLLEIVFKLASNYKDWGGPGIDNFYGHGGIYFPEYKPNSKFIYKEMNNINANANGPFIDMPQADNLVNQNSNLYFLGETFDAVNPGSIIIDKKNVYRSAGKTSIVKE